jgi:hypothetical protein
MPSGSGAKGGFERTGMPLLSVITAAYNEEENLPLFYERVAAVLDGNRHLDLAALGYGEPTAGLEVPAGR